MPRRKRIFRKFVSCDAVYNSSEINVFINKLMYSGKKSTAERIFYDAIERLPADGAQKRIEVFFLALKNVIPLMEVKSRRVGGSNYQVPIEVPEKRGQALAARWLIAAARTRAGLSMVEKLSKEIQEASQGIGAAIKKREEVHKMAESNKAFAHFRW